MDAPKNEMSKKMIVLKSSDGESFEIEEAVALQSKTITNIVEDGYADNVVPLANVTSGILAKVIEYCKKHVDDDNDSASNETKEEIKKWDAEFMEIDQDTLLDLIDAANYLNIENLLDLTCQKVADMMKCKTTDEIRTTFNIVNDYTPEEEAEVRAENQWAFE